MRKIKISEQQDRYIQHILSESGLNPNANTNQGKNGVKVPGGTVTTDFTPDKPVSPEQQLNMTASASKTTKVNGVDTPTETEMKINGEEKTVTVQESFLITKKQLDEVKLKNMKNGSQVIKVKNFLR